MLGLFYTGVPHQLGKRKAVLVLDAVAKSLIRKINALQDSIGNDGGPDKPVQPVQPVVPVAPV